ncbi:ABC transporter permease [Salinibacterium sp. ZJ454]|uniref:ABC transporter permease n=1 Tax=Salinibacterium sp. ZJ454 TaxID=2708339 RepID=UPI001423B6F9|nr:ABC transporter permease [Salinibacterium sp. ZJ454]
MSRTLAEAPPEAQLDKAQTDREGQQKNRLFLARFALPALLVVFVVAFSLALPNTYATLGNLQTTLSTQAVLGILVISLLFPLIIGEFDLSVAANLGLSAVVCTVVPAMTGLNWVLGILLAIVISTLIGFFNGLLVSRLGINSLIVTLGSSTIITGAVLWYTNGSVVFEGVPDELSGLVKGDLLGVPLPAVYLLVIAVVAYFVLEQTPLGRRLYALGGSKEASRLSGLRVPRLTLTAFGISGLLAGLAGVVQAGLLGVGNPTVGPPFLLPAFAGIFLGATAIKIGVFNVWGSIIAVYTLAAGITGLQLLGVPFYVGPIFQGVALLVAVIAVRLLRREAL